MNRFRTAVAVIVSVAAAAALLLALLEAGRRRPDVLPDGASPPEVPPDAPPVPDAASLLEPGAGSPSRSSKDLLPETPPPVPSGAVLCSGRVLDLETGLPVPRFTLRLVAEDPPAGEREAESRFDGAGGEFAVGRLPFAPRTLEVRADGYEELAVPFRPPEGKPWMLYLERPAFEVRVRLLDGEGRPFPNGQATIWACLLGSESLEARAKGLRKAGEHEAAQRIQWKSYGEPGPDGTFRIFLRHAGRHRFQGEYVLGVVEEKDLSIAPDSGEVVLTARATSGGLWISGSRLPEVGRIAAVVIDVDETGKPSWWGNFALEPREKWPMVFTPGKRTFHFCPIEGAFAPWHADLDLAAGRWTELEFDYMPAAPLRGRVVDATGLPAEGLKVEARWRAAEPGVAPPSEGESLQWKDDFDRERPSSVIYDRTGLWVSFGCRTEKEGRFEFPGLAGLSCSLFVDAGACGGHRVEVAAGTGEMEVRLPFSLNRRVLRLRLPAVHDFKFVSVRIWGPLLLRKEGFGHPPQELELAFLVDSWPELDVEIEAWDRKTGLKVAAFEVPEGAKIFEACPSFLPPASVRVALADADSGKLLKGQVIRIFEGLARGAERIPESFKVVQWPPGEYEITAFADGYKPETIPVRVVSGEVRDLGTIRLRRKDK